MKIKALISAKAKKFDYRKPSISEMHEDLQGIFTYKQYHSNNFIFTHVLMLGTTNIPVTCMFTWYISRVALCMVIPCVVIPHVWYTAKKVLLCSVM